MVITRKWPRDPVCTRYTGFEKGYKGMVINYGEGRGLNGFSHAEGGVQKD